MVKWPKLFGLHKFYFDSNFHAEPVVQTIPVLPEPIYWRKLYPKAENIFLMDGDISELETKCENAKDLNDKEKQILANFYKDDRSAEEVKGLKNDKAAVLTRLKQYLFDRDESHKSLNELKASVEIIIPRKQDATSKEQVAAANTDIDSKALEDCKNSEYKEGSIYERD